MKHAIFAVMMTVLWAFAVLSDDMPPKDTIDQATMDRAYAKLRERPNASSTQPSILLKAVQPHELTSAYNLKELSDAAAMELATARAEAIRKYRESDAGKAAISAVDDGLKKRNNADISARAGDKANAAQNLLEARKYLAESELYSAAIDPVVKTATVKAEHAEAAYQFQRSEAAKATALEIKRIARNVELGMSVHNIITVLGEPESDSTTDGDRKSYQWVVYSHGKRKLITRIVTADAKYGAITSVRDTHFKVDDDD